MQTAAWIFVGNLRAKKHAAEKVMGDQMVRTIDWCLGYTPKFHRLPCTTGTPQFLEHQNQELKYEYHMHNIDHELTSINSIWALCSSLLTTRSAEEVRTISHTLLYLYHILHAEHAERERYRVTAARRWEYLSPRCRTVQSEYTHPLDRRSYLQVWLV